VPGDIDQDGLRIAQPDVAVFHHRDLAERIELQELLGLVLLIDEIDRDALARNLEDVEQQTDFVAASRQLEII
jgi:hypothetical protein